MMLLASCFCLHRHDAVLHQGGADGIGIMLGRSHVALFDSASMVKVLQVTSGFAKPKPKREVAKL